MSEFVEKEVSDLEQDWIAAEAEADLAKEQARRAERAADELRRIASQDRPDVKILIGQAAHLASRREQAEQEAAAAFDRFWSARNADAKAL